MVFVPSPRGVDASYAPMLILHVTDHRFAGLSSAHLHLTVPSPVVSYPMLLMVVSPDLLTSNRG